MNEVDPGVWERAKTLFAEAREIGAGEWDAFLDERCGDDPELRRLLQALLEGHRQVPPHFLSSPGQDRFEGRSIGPYKLVRRLGHGGMGTVYLAERADESFRKTVALKLLTSDMDEIVHRFRTERQILAGLDHPNIAKLLDGGSTDDGLPFFVMEYVDGRPIDEYCDAERLTVRERLELFRTVCLTVQFAHQNLVVHRDLKPDNVLVTSDGTPKLLDFGIAKLLNPEIAFRRRFRTEPALQPMTPRFASPEQVRGDPITTASDVYTLGVLLYVLLTGRHPYRIESRSRAEMEKVICEEEPEKLSTVVGRRQEILQADGTRHTLTPEIVSERRGGEPGWLRRRLAGDLENVVRMAMRKEPGRRYASAEQLAADVRRHLEGHPVLATGDSLGYRARKFIRRHRIGVAATAAFLAAAIGFGAVMAVQHQRLVTTLARERFVTGFLIDLFETANPFATSHQEVSTRTILEQGAEKLEVAFADQPATRAELMSTIGSIYLKLGDPARAGSLLEQALETRREIFGEDHLEVAESLDLWARVLQARGEYESAAPLFRQALEIRRRHLGEPDAAVAKSLHHLALLLQEQGRYDDAEGLLTEALEMRRELFGGRDVVVGESLSDLAWVLKHQGEEARAEECLREALEIFRRNLGPRHLFVAAGLNNLAFFVRDRGDLDAAESYFHEALAILRERLEDDHPEIGTALHNLAGVLRARGEDAEAKALYREALEIRRQRLGNDHPLVANTLFKLGELLASRSEHEEAAQVASEALDILRRSLGPRHAYTRKTAELLVTVYEALGRTERAAELRARHPAEPLLR